MKNLCLLILGLLITFSAYGEAKTTYASGDLAWIARFSCRGKIVIGAGGVAYDAVLEGGYSGGINSGTVMLSGSGIANGIFAELGIYRDGEYTDYFQDVQLTGLLRMDDQKQPLDFSVNGPQLPNHRNIQLNIPLDGANTEARFVIQRQDEFGGNASGTLACKILVPGQCRTETQCHRECRTGMGCHNVCHPETICF